MHTVACPFCYFRWNTVMHSAVTHHSQGSGFFSPASDVVRAVWEEVARPPGPLSVLEYAGGGTPAPKPLAEAGQWAVLAAKHALVLPALQRG